MQKTKKREIFWHTLLPIYMFVPGLTSLISKWIILLSRFGLFAAVISRNRISMVSLVIAYLIEALAFSFISWLFGRSFM
jgi:hypothetical protein